MITYLQLYRLKKFANNQYILLLLIMQSDIEVGIINGAWDIDPGTVHIFLVRNVNSTRLHPFLTGSVL